MGAVTPLVPEGPQAAPKLVAGAPTLPMPTPTCAQSPHCAPAPAVDVALLVPHGHRHCPDLAEVKAHVVLMVVRRDPAHPHTAGLLTCEDPHRVIVLGTQREDQGSVRKAALLGTLNPSCGFWEFNRKLLNERSLETKRLRWRQSSNSSRLGDGFLGNIWWHPYNWVPLQTTAKQ